MSFGEASNGFFWQHICHWEKYEYNIFMLDPIDSWGCYIMGGEL